MRASCCGYANVVALAGANGGQPQNRRAASADGLCGGGHSGHASSPPSFSFCLSSPRRRVLLRLPRRDADPAEEAACLRSASTVAVLGGRSLCGETELPAASGVCKRRLCVSLGTRVPLLPSSSRSYDEACFHGFLLRSWGLEAKNTVLKAGGKRSLKGWGRDGRRGKSREVTVAWAKRREGLMIGRK